MRKGVRGMRRVAAVLSVSLVTLLVTGVGAGASPVGALKNYEAVGFGQVLGLEVNLPDALGAVLSPAGVPANINQVIAFSRSIGQVSATTTNVGTGLGQMTEGTLNPILEQVSTAVLGKKLPRVFASLGEALQSDNLAAINLGSLAGLTDPIVSIGVADVNAVSSLKNVANGLKAVVSHSDSKILGAKIDLGATLTGTLQGVLQPVLDVTDAPGGLIDTINGGLDTVEGIVEDTLGVSLNLDLPRVEELLSQPLLTVGLIETGSDTNYLGAARNARGVTRLVDVDIFGTGDNALVHIDSLSTETFAEIGGSSPVATAINKIVGLKVLGNKLDLEAGSLTINGRAFELPIASVLEPLKNLLIDTLGLRIDVLSATKEASALHSRAEANTIAVSLTPAILGATKPLIAITGPASMAEVSGTIQGAPPTVGRFSPQTGLSDNLYLLAGPALIGMAVLVRRFALSR